MDTKDKAIIWVLYLIVAMIMHLNLYAVITGAIIIGIAIKIIDANFANIIYRKSLSNFDMSGSFWQEANRRTNRKKGKIFFISF